MIAPKVVLGHCDRCDASGWASDEFKGRVPCPACPRGLEVNGARNEAVEADLVDIPGPGDDEEPCGWEPVNLAAAVDRNGPLPPELLERSDGICLLYPGRCHAFIGEPEGMK